MKKAFLKLMCIVLMLSIFVPILASCDDGTNDGDNGNDIPAKTEATVTFDSDGGSAVESKTVKIGDKVEKPNDPTKDGFTFYGWYNGDELWAFSHYHIEEDVTLKARWIPNATPGATTYTVVFDTGTSDSFPNQTIEEGHHAINPGKPNRTGYTFIGWYNGENAWDFSVNTVTYNITLTAKWSKIDVAVVSFDTDTSAVIPSQVLSLNAKAIKPEEPKLNGWKFAGWYNGDVQWNFADPVTENMTLTAKWDRDTARAEVKFDANGGTLAEGTENIGIDVDTYIEEPENPTKDGYTFYGWYNGNTKWNFQGYKTNGNMTLKARWIKNCDYGINVTFDTDGGSGFDDQTVAEGQLAVNPGEPERVGYDFVGWFLGASGFNFNADVITSDMVDSNTGDVIITAKWAKKNNVHTVRFDTDGAGYIDSVLVEDGDKVTSPGAPVRDGYVFDAWYNGSEKYDFSTEVTSDITLKAVYTSKNDPSILDSGTCAADGSEGTKFTWKVDANYTLTISGSGETNMNYTTAPWHEKWHSEIVKIVMDEGVTGNVMVGWQALFYNFQKLEEIVYPSTYTRYLMVYGCTRLKTIIIPDTVTRLENGSVAAQCPSLETIVIPAKITGAISPISSGGCYSLRTIIVLGNPSLSGSAGACLNPLSASKNLTIYCKKNSAMQSSLDRANADGYNFHYEFIDLSSESNKSAPINENVSWIYTENKELLIYGKGAMNDYAEDKYFTPRWYEFGYVNEVETLKVLSGVTHVGSYAFNYMTKLKKAYIADTVRSIGDGAFRGCNNVQFIDIGGGVTYIGNDVFYGVNPRFEFRCALNSFGLTYAKTFGYNSKIASGYILGVGNSLTNDSFGSGSSDTNGSFWLRRIIDELCPDNRIVLGELTYGGRTMKTHYEYLLQNKSDASFIIYFSPLLSNFGMNNYTYKEQFLALDWDVIVLQDYEETIDRANGNVYSGETLKQTMQNFVKLLRSYGFDDTKIFWFDPWLSPYQSQSEYGASRIRVYNDLPTLWELDSEGNEIVGDNVIDGVIAGYSMLENMKTTYLGTMKQNNGKNGSILYRQSDVHLNFEVSRFSAALTWVKALLDYDISQTRIYADNKDQPGAVDENMRLIAVECAENAVKYPFEIINSIHTENPIDKFASSINGITVDFISALTEQGTKDKLVREINRFIRSYNDPDIDTITLEDITSFDFENKKVKLHLATGYVDREVEVSYETSSNFGSVASYNGFKFANRDGNNSLVSEFIVNKKAIETLENNGYKVKIKTLTAALSELKAAGVVLTPDVTFATVTLIYDGSVNKLTDKVDSYIAEAILSEDAVDSFTEAYVFALSIGIYDENDDKIGEVNMYADAPISDTEGELSYTADDTEYYARTFYYVAKRYLATGMEGLSYDLMDYVVDVIRETETSSQTDNVNGDFNIKN
ncbi:MAG: InlB B-repeat-containing protein [Eubacteriales bacterium]|nr:InlB B-repeat-containing protein [Eubacteriales bacterium]